MFWRRWGLTAGAAGVMMAGGCASVPPGPANDLAALRSEVMATEIAFAKSMADRNLVAFTGFLADDAVFFSGPTPLRGKAAVAAGWKGFFEAHKAPFSWHPETVEVLDAGQLALSSGPVLNPAGQAVASFTSIWRREAPGVWRIVFDKGCNCP